MSCRCSNADREFRQSVDTGCFPVGDFDHRAHLRLAYAHLVEGGERAGVERMKASILRLLAQAGVDPATKYHETLTRAWLLAVLQAMDKEGDCPSADAFLERHPELLRKDLLDRHYSPARLQSDDARGRWLPPDREPFPGGLE